MITALDLLSYGANLLRRQSKTNAVLGEDFLAVAARS